MKDIATAGDGVDGNQDIAGDGKVGKEKRNLQSGSPSPEHKRQRTGWSGWWGFGGE